MHAARMGACAHEQEYAHVCESASAFVGVCAKIDRRITKTDLLNI